MEKIPTYQVVYSPETAEGIFAVSLVADPANESMFITLSKDEPIEMKLSTDANEKRLITGVVLIPNQPIYRMNKKTNQEYNLVFGTEEIRMLSQDFFKNGYQSSANIEHDDSKEIVGLTYVESWIVEDPANDKSNALGLQNIVKGSWLMSAYVEDDSTWEMAKSGELKGFSIEAYLSNKLVEMNNENNNIIKNKTKMNLLDKIIKLFSDEEIELAAIAPVKEETPAEDATEAPAVEKEEEVTLSGVTATVEAGTLTADAFEIDAMVMLGDAPYEGEFTVDGLVYETDADGKITSIETVKAEAEEVAEETAEVNMASELKLSVENLTKELEAVILSNKELKLQVEELSKLPSATKLKANEVSVSTKRETSMELINRLTKK